MSRRLRVLMTADTVGGVWTYACELARALDAQRVDIVLATMGAPLTAAQRRTVATLANVEVHESEYALEWMPSPWRDVDAASEWLLRLAARVQPDLIHVNGYAHAALPFGVPVISVAHSCVATWMAAVRGQPLGEDWNEYRQRVTRGLAAADAIVGPTRSILEAVLAAYGIARTGTVIPNGRALTVTPCPKESFVLAAGRLWDEAKGLADLITYAQRSSWPVRVAGPRTMPGATSAVEAPGVELLGELSADEVVTWMRRAAIYALPARYEPFGLSILEAALCSCALVVGDIPTLREVWGDAAVYVPPGDPEALAFHLDVLAGDPLRRGALGVAARARAAQYSPRHMAAGYRALYDGLVAARAARESQEVYA